MNAVRVFANPVPARRADQPWFVSCLLCLGEQPGATDPGSWLALLAATMRPLGWARDWASAQNFAVRHALAHEALRCPTCLHVPARSLTPEEATQ